MYSQQLEEEKEEEMSLKRKRGLRELFASRANGLSPKDASGSQLPPPHPSANPFALANLKKRKKDKEVVEEGELVPYNEGVPPKLPKTAKGKGRTSSAKGREVDHEAKVCTLNPAWNLELELDGAAIP